MQVANMYMEKTREQQHFRFRWLALIVLYPVTGHAALAEIRKLVLRFLVPLTS